MTFPITPVPSFHIDPLAPQEAQQQLQALRASLQQMFAQLGPQIIQLVVNSILQAFGLGKISGTIDSLLTGLENAMKAIPSGNISGAIASIDQALRDAIANALGHAGSNFSLTNVESFLQSIPGGNIAGILTNALQNALNIFGQLRPLSMPILPASHIRNINPNLLNDPSFTTTSGVMTANGTLQQLLSNPIPVTQGETLDLSVGVAWTGLSSTSSPAPLQMIARPYNAGVAGTDSVIGSDASPGASGSTTFSGTYTVPASVDTVYQVVLVDTTATAGTVTWSTASVTKAGTLVAGTGLIDSFENTLTHLFGSNTLGTNFLAGLLPNALGGSNLVADLTTLGTTLFGSATNGTHVLNSAITNALGGLNLGADLSALGTTLFGSPTNGSHVLNTAVANALGGTSLGADLSTVATTLFGSATTATQVLGTSISNVLGGSSLSHDVQTFLDTAVNALSGGAGSGNPLSALTSNLKTISQANNIAVPPNPGTGTITHDASSNGTYNAGPASSITISWTHTAASTADFATIKSSYYYAGQPANLQMGATWDGAPMTLLTSNATNSMYSQIWGLQDPPGVGTAVTVEFVVYITYGIYNILGTIASADSYIGVGNVGSAVSTIGPSTSNPSVSISSQSSDFVINLITTDTTSGNCALTSYNQTSRYHMGQQAFSGGAMDFWAGDAAGASTVTFDCLDSGTNDAWIAMAVNLAPNPSTIIGSGFHVTRTNTAGWNPATGNQMVQSSWFSATPTANTPDLTWSASTDTLTVSHAGWYMVSISYYISATNNTESFAVVLYQNAAVVQVSGGNWSSGTSDQHNLGSCFVVYCSAGDTLTPGFYTSAGGTIGLAGESTGTQCYFSVALMNRSVY